MKRKSFKIISISVISLMVLYSTTVYASGGDLNSIIMDSGMDAVLSQSYESIDNTHDVSDQSLDAVHMADELSHPMFFPDILDVFTPGRDSGNNSLDIDGITPAIDNGSWNSDFNDFFNNSPSVAPVDIEMQGVDVSNSESSLFQEDNDGTKYLSFTTTEMNLEFSNPQADIVETLNPDNNTDMVAPSPDSELNFAEETPAAELPEPPKDENSNSSVPLDTPKKDKN